MKKSIVVWTAVFVCLGLFFWVASGRLSATVDDAFIAFRYAKHFAEGKGLVYNAGERVEGYTSFLWVVLMAAGRKVGLDMPAFARTVSIICAALLVVAVSLFSKSSFRDSPFPYLSYLAPVLLALNPVFIEHIGSGMETLLFALLMFFSIAAYLNHAHKARLPYLTGFLLGLGYLTRPEAVIWACSMVAVDVSSMLLKREKFSERMPEVAKYAGVFASVVLLHLAWRVSYYDSWLPNTYYAKGAVNWSSGIYYTAHFLLSTGFIPLFVMVAGPLLLRRKWAVCFCVIIAATFFHSVRIGGDFIFTGRFLYALLPLIYILTQELVRLSVMAAMKSANVPLVKRILWSVAGAALIVAFLLGAARGLAYARLGVQVCEEINKTNVRLLKCLEQHTQPTDTIAVIAAGIVPYYSENTVIDMLGLTDSHIARYGLTDKRCTIGHQKADPDYVLDRRPDVILVLPPPPELRRISHPLNLRIAANQYMLENPRFRNLYEKVDVDCDIYPYRMFSLKERT